MDQQEVTPQEFKVEEEDKEMEDGEEEEEDGEEQDEDGEEDEEGEDGEEFMEIPPDGDCFFKCITEAFLLEGEDVRRYSQVIVAVPATTAYPAPNPLKDWVK